jgi:hypothetical protein
MGKVNFFRYNHLRVDLYTPELARANPSYVFFFGDNTYRKGLGGQACIRMESNAIGIITKVAPSDTPASYFYDEHEPLYKWLLEAEHGRISRLLDSMPHVDTLVFPSAGLGTGLADMPRRSPKCYAALQDFLWQKFGVSNVAK